jgi:hypothetical protein
VLKHVHDYSVACLTVQQPSFVSLTASSRVPPYPGDFSELDLDMEIDGAGYLDA